MKQTPFFIFIAMIAIGIILLNTVDSLKFLTCEDLDNYDIIVNEVTSTEVDLTISKDTDSETFSSYEYLIEDGVLYVGAKFTMNPLNDNPNSSYHLVLETEEEITEIVVKDATKSNTIYSTD